MRSPDVQQLGMFSYVWPERRVPADHPVRKLHVMVDGILRELDDLLAERYANGGRPSIPLERIPRASLLQVVHSVRSERLLMEQLDYDLLFRWFVGLNMDDLVWDHSTFSFNRERLFNAEIVQRFFEHTVLLARLQELVSDEHFSVDGTAAGGLGLAQELSPQGRQRRRWRRPPRTDAKQRHPCLDHRSGRATEAQGQRQGSQAELPGQRPMENRSGLLVAVEVRHASGTGERDGALDLLAANVARGATLGADKGTAPATSRHR